MKRYLSICLVACFTLQTCSKQRPLADKREMMPPVLAKFVRQYHQTQGYKTNVYFIRFMNEHDSSRFIILPILNQGQMQRARPFKLLKVDTLFVLCSTGYEFFESNSAVLAEDSVKLASLLDPFTLPAPFNPPVWRGIIFNKDSIRIDKIPKNPYGMDPCLEVKPIQFIPLSKIKL